MWINLACLFALALTPRTAALGDQDAPAGCSRVFAATTRGGASASPPRGDCNIFRRDLETRDITRVIDGDTIVVAGGDRVRYIGVDAPEIGGEPELFGTEASAFNSGLVLNQEVMMEKDASEADRFGRLLRYVYVDGILVNAELVREGYARGVSYRPDTKYDRCFTALEEEARVARRGMWAR